MNNRFIQIHFLTSYPAALLNRDDAGFAKRVPFGGATRTRISSQCLKRHWRTFEGDYALSELGDLSIRSRLTFERFVVEPLAKEHPESIVRAATEAIMAGVLGQSAKAAKKKADEEDSEKAIETGQITVLGKPEVDYLRQLVQEICVHAGDDPKAAAKYVKDKQKEWKANLAAVGDAGIDAALFGRMVTSDILARRDAAIHVAHAMTVHAEASESDYFSAIDDLRRSDDTLGSGHIGTVELTSGLYYGYVVVDVPLLVSNLMGGKAKDANDEDRELAGKVVQHLVHLVTTVSPGAKLGSTAPYAYAHWVMVEAGKSQPRTLANAFLQPVRERPDLLANSYDAIASYLAATDKMYGASATRVAAAIHPTEKLASTIEMKDGIAQVASWAAARVREG